MAIWSFSIANWTCNSDSADRETKVEKPLQFFMDLFGYPSASPVCWRPAFRLSILNLGVVFFEERRDSLMWCALSRPVSAFRPSGCSSLAGGSGLVICLGRSSVRARVESKAPRTLSSDPSKTLMLSSAWFMLRNLLTGEGWWLSSSTAQIWPLISSLICGGAFPCIANQVFGKIRPRLTSYRPGKLMRIDEAGWAPLPYPSRSAGWLIHE